MNLLAQSLSRKSHTGYISMLFCLRGRSSKDKRTSLAAGYSSPKAFSPFMSFEAMTSSNFNNRVSMINWLLGAKVTKR